ncbi:MAG: DUF6320 domain-containing protein [Lachnospiraceae bacterium]|nr:DUF6320 domain-containing protein [Lachnospiraceae bacterium]
MSKCRYCGIEVLDDTEHCPLCQGVLEQSGERVSTYPNAVAERKKKHFVFRLILFLSVVAGMICFVVNRYATPQSNWSIIVIASLVYALWMVYIILKDNAGYRVRILSGVAGGVVLIILLDALTGFGGWSINYVFPFAIILVDVALVILMLINRRNWQSYLILQFFMILVGVVPIILCKKGIVTTDILANIVFLVTLILFLGSVILGGKTAKNELVRRFHI